MRIDLIDPLRAGIFADARSFKNRRTIDFFSVHLDRVHASAGRDRIDRPRYRHAFSAACSAGGYHRVSHTAVRAIKHNVFNFADLLALGSLHLRADDLTGFDVSLVLGLTFQRNNSQTQDGQNRVKE